jgi:hypothetical protein
LEISVFPKRKTDFSLFVIIESSLVLAMACMVVGGRRERDWWISLSYFGKLRK